MESKIRVAIVDDHQSTLDGYRFRLGQMRDIELVGAIAFGEELEPLLANGRADVLILDVHVPTASDNPNPYPILHLVPKLLQRHPDLSILIISMLRTRSLIQELLAAGASGYVLKNDRAAIQVLGEIVRSVANGEMYLSEEVRRLLDEAADGHSGLSLTRRQQGALSLCAAHPDWTHMNLAKHLSVTSSTARNTLHNAYVRLGVANLASAIAKARALGLITPVEPQ